MKIRRFIERTKRRTRIVKRGSVLSSIIYVFEKFITFALINKTEEEKRSLV